MKELRIRLNISFSLESITYLGVKWKVSYLLINNQVKNQEWCYAKRNKLFCIWNRTLRHWDR